jgi:hypothetical protein
VQVVARLGRGQVAVRTSIRGHDFVTVVEPDGRGGHWIRVDVALQRVAGVSPGDAAELTLEVSPAWPEPNVPADLAAALAAAPAEIRDAWQDITPMARWEWVRWVQATSDPQTRQRRVEVSISKLDSGKRRPCCFDLSSCTDPNLARSGKLRDFPREGFADLSPPSGGPPASVSPRRGSLTSEPVDRN